MHKLLLTILMLGASFGCALGGVKCFLTQLAYCSQLAGGKSITEPAPGYDFCMNIGGFFDCVRRKEIECFVDYNLNEMEIMVDDICTNGTFLNKRFLKYQDCILQSVQNQRSCSQVIYDFVMKFEELTPDVFFEMYKLICRERHNIHRCLYNYLEMDCGKNAKIFIEIISKPSEKINKKICGDVWQLDAVGSQFLMHTLLQNTRR